MDEVGNNWNNYFDNGIPDYSDLYSLMVGYVESTDVYDQACPSGCSMPFTSTDLSNNIPTIVTYGSSLAAFQARIVELEYLEDISEFEYEFYDEVVSSIYNDTDEETVMEYVDEVEDVIIEDNELDALVKARILISISILRHSWYFAFENAE